MSERLSHLEKQIAPFRRLQAESPDEYSVRVATFYGMLRETWEQVVEERLLNDVTRRFRPSIETNRLKEVTIEPSDFIAINTGMSRCSAQMIGHDSAAAIGSPPPTYDEVVSDLKFLKDFAKALKVRSENTRKAIGELVDAPAGKISAVRADTVVDLA